MRADIDMLVSWRADRRPILVTAAQQSVIRGLFAGGASDAELALAVHELPPATIPRIRGAMKLVRRTPAGGNQASRIPKHLDGLPRMIVSAEALARSYMGRRYGP